AEDFRHFDYILAMDNSNLADLRALDPGPGVAREGLVLATLKAGELFGKMASILGERERTARAVTATNAVIDVIDSTTMRRKLGEADPVLRALVRNLTIRLADANKMNQKCWLLLNVYQGLAPDEIERT
ncbi:MAG: hypothetical protein ACPHIV_04475, partial [Candidatus Puniceispirillaceae bacterium]